MLTLNKDVGKGKQRCRKRQIKMSEEANKDQKRSLGEGVRNKKDKVKERIRLNNKRRKVNKIKKKRCRKVLVELKLLQ